MKVLAFCLLATCVLSEIAHAEPPGQLLSQGGAGTYVRPYFAMYKDLATGLTMRYEQGQSIPNDQFPYFGTVDYKVQQVKRTLIGTFDAFQFFVVQDIDNQLDLTFSYTATYDPYTAFYQGNIDLSEKVGLENFTGGVVSRNLTTVRTLQWASEYDGCVSNGYQESTARINYRGQEIDKVTYSFSVKPYAWPNQFAPQVLSVNRRPVDALALDGTVAFQGGLALDHTQANTGPPPFPPHGNLYGTHNDWIFDPCLRASAFWSGYVILINPPWNTFPQLWSDGEMQWMTRMESA